jgi:hypothetical protein
MHKYSEILKFSGNGYDKLVYIDDTRQVVFSTNGQILMARKDLYPEVKVIARLNGTEKPMICDDSGVLSVTNTNNLDMSGIIPNVKEDYRKISLTIPEWITGIKKAKKDCFVYFTLGNTPTLSITRPSEVPFSIVNLRYLEFFAGKTVTAYVPSKERKALVFCPEGQELSSADFFVLVMPISDSNLPATKYLKE